jgi:hypothetical protein
LITATCNAVRPGIQGGSESTVKLAKADLVPTDANLLPGYASFEVLEAACRAFCDQVKPGRTGSPAAPRRKCWAEELPGCTRSRWRRSPQR